MKPDALQSSWPAGRLLVANRGEIARRILRSGRALGFEVGVLVADDDHDSVAARDVPEHCRVAVPRYLDLRAVVAAAKAWNAAVVHPGYGFLSENAEFAAALESEGIRFAGPTSRNMQTLGDKENAKRLAQKIGVPTLPAVFAADLQGDSARWPDHLVQQGIALPWLIKASGGGGGRGMRVVTRAEDLGSALRRASDEAASGFGNPAVFVERYLERTRHIEVQIFGDGKGGGVALGERECSLQRRHQKVVEEAPSPAVNPELRQRLGQAALRFVVETKYRGAGTVEFLLAEDGQFYFLEVNTRLQVEHPVTEQEFGVDLVAAQLRLAAWGQWDPALGDASSLCVRAPRVHSIEVRVLAEDPWDGFCPTPGEVLAYAEPPGAHRDDVQATAQSGALPAAFPCLRFESALERPRPGCPVRVHPGYDSMIAKIIATGSDRAEATCRLLAGLSQTVVNGIRCNLDFLQVLLGTSAFAEADFHTRWIEEHLEELRAEALGPKISVFPCSERLAESLPEVLFGGRDDPASSFVRDSDGLVVECVPQGVRRSAIAILANGSEEIVGTDPGGVSRWVLLSGHDIREWARRVLAVGPSASNRVVGNSHWQEWAKGAPVPLCVTYAGGGRFWMNLLGVSVLVEQGESVRRGPRAHQGLGSILAPMPGKIVSVLAREGERVTERQVLFVMESMKMQIDINAPGSGTIVKLSAAQGQIVEAGFELCELKENEP